MEQELGESKTKLAASEQRNETKNLQLVGKHQQLVEKHQQLQEKDRRIDRLFSTGKEDADRLLREKEGELALLREELRRRRGGSVAEWPAVRAADGAGDARAAAKATAGCA